MIREINLSDKKEYIGMADSFYNSNAVSHSIPKENFESAFEAAISNNPFIKLYMLEICCLTNNLYFLLADSKRT